MMGGSHNTHLFTSRLHLALLNWVTSGTQVFVHRTAEWQAISVSMIMTIGRGGVSFLSHERTETIIPFGQFVVMEDSLCPFCP